MIPPVEGAFQVVNPVGGETSAPILFVSYSSDPDLRNSRSPAGLVDRDPQRRPLRRRGNDLEACWEQPGKQLRLYVKATPHQAMVYEASDATLVLLGSLYDFEHYTIREAPETHRCEVTHAFSDASSILKALPLANGCFLAILLRSSNADTHVGGEPILSFVTSWSPPFPIYYGHRNGRIAVSTSPQSISDFLGYNRAPREDRIVDICLHRYLTDNGTLFEGVFRLYSNERLDVVHGQVRLYETDSAAPVPPQRNPDDPMYLTLGRRLVSHAVRRRAHSGPVTVLLSNGLDSRTLLAIARQEGIDDVAGLTIGSSRSDDEAAGAKMFAQEHGYPCHVFHEEELDLRGILEEYLPTVGFPPRLYNHLLLEAAVRQMPQRGGQLWSGDMGTLEGIGSIYIKSMKLRALHRWIPPARVLKLVQPAGHLFSPRIRSELWQVSLNTAETLIVSLSPHKTPELAQAALSIFNRRLRDAAEGPKNLPQATPGLVASVGRRPGFRWHDWQYLWGDVVYAGALVSRLRLAAQLSARFETPFRDAALGAFSCDVLSTLPPEQLYTRVWKETAFEPWVPRSKRGKKGRLIGDLPVWFRQKTKLADYLDLVASDNCLGRGFFDPIAVRALLDRRMNLSKHEAQRLWTILCFEMLFATGVLRT
jgi:hypothetical protein